MAPPQHTRDCVWDGESWSHHAADCVLHDDSLSPHDRREIAHAGSAGKSKDAPGRTVQEMGGQASRAITGDHNGTTEEAKVRKNTPIVANDVAMGDVGNEDRLATMERRLQALEAREKQMFKRKSEFGDEGKHEDDEIKPDMEQRLRLLAEIDGLKGQLRARQEEGLKSEEELAAAKGTIANQEKEIEILRRSLKAQKEEGCKEMESFKTSKDVEILEMKKSKEAELKDLQTCMDEKLRQLELDMDEEICDLKSDLKEVEEDKDDLEEEIYDLKKKLKATNEKNNGLEVMLSSIKDAVNRDESARSAKRPRIDSGPRKGAMPVSPFATKSPLPATETSFEKLRESYPGIKFIAQVGNLMWSGPQLPECLHTPLLDFVQDIVQRRKFLTKGDSRRHEVFTNPRRVSSCVGQMTAHTTSVSIWPKSQPRKRACYRCSKRQSLCVIVNAESDSKDFIVLPLMKELRITSDYKNIDMWICQKSDDIRTPILADYNHWEP
ncbi:uncharacterized protein BDZ99DRAFT_546516 [Mytilinidion resinicola]|uniref:Uncharacterized protein n=1 Tax=Mytilinidion resinicola TaxID=574789 RepID=A0A6A6Y7C9_9PEZI|nr:uncharacterized protein BDZ99DRAFT_546516 [Mytilinidion resinicola]KAF2803884.1 hypothetical protein BDZ99DRAFT_546516 [Mytilinidion resinicola]